MADHLSIDRRTSALLVMDFQTLIVDNYAAGAAALLDRTAKLIAAARTGGMRVIYVVVGFRPGYPEVSNRNATFNGLEALDAFAAGVENAKDPSRRRAAGRGNRRHQASGERLRRNRSRADAARQRHRDPDPHGDRHQRRRTLDPLPCRRCGLQTAGRPRLLLWRRQGSASGTVGEGLSAPGHHHDGCGTRAGHRSWAVDAVTASNPSPRRAALLSSFALAVDSMTVLNERDVSRSREASRCPERAGRHAAPLGSVIFAFPDPWHDALLHSGPATSQMAATPEPGCEARGRAAYP